MFFVFWLSKGAFQQNLEYFWSKRAFFVLLSQECESIVRLKLEFLACLTCQR